MVQTWRIHIRPKSGKQDAKYSFRLCLDREILGCGWEVDADESRPLTPEKYLELNEARDGPGQSRTARLLMEIAQGDLIWTRSTTGIYYLARVTGPWEYRGTQDFVDADVVNIRPVRLVRVGTEDLVPGKIVSCFRPSRTLQRINDETAALYSQRLWKQSTTEESSEPSANDMDIFSLLSAEDVEDVIFVYLQHQGWIVRPARRRAQTIAYEFTLMSRDGLKEAVVQVKTGHTPVDLSKLPTEVDVAFAFQPNGLIAGTNPSATVISREEVLAFMHQNPRLLPGTVQVWTNRLRPVHTESTRQPA